MAATFEIPSAHWINVNLPASCPPSPQHFPSSSPLPPPHFHSQLSFLFFLFSLSSASFHPVTLRSSILFFFLPLSLSPLIFPFFFYLPCAPSAHPCYPYFSSPFIPCSLASSLFSSQLSSPFLEFLTSIFAFTLNPPLLLPFTPTHLPYASLLYLAFSSPFLSFFPLLSIHPFILCDYLWQYMGWGKAQ